MRCHFVSVSRKLYRDMVMDMATVPPACRPLGPLPGKVFSTRLCRPGALQLPSSTEDCVFEFGFGLSRYRRLGPLPICRTLLPIDGNGERIGMQRSGQDEDIDPIAEIGITRR